MRAAKVITVCCFALAGVFLVAAGQWPWTIACFGAALLWQRTSTARRWQARGAAARGTHL